MEEELVDTGFVLLHREDSVIDNSQSSLEAARRSPLGKGKRSGPRSPSSTAFRVICYPYKLINLILVSFDFGTELERLQSL